MNLSQSIHEAGHSLFTGVRDALTAVGQGVDGSLEQFARHTADEFSDVGAALRRGDWLGAGVEFAELVSPGAHVANALDASGLLPADPLLHNAVSAGVNLLGGGLSPLSGGVAFVKDLVESGQALSSRLQPRPQPGAAVAHTPPVPERAHARACARPPRGYPTGDAVGAPNWQRPHDVARACLSAHPWLVGCPSRLWLREMDRCMRRALREAGVVPDGGNCRQQPLRERSIEDILRDPSLCFEDQVAMFMARFMEDRQEEVKEQMRRMARQGAASSLEGREREAAVDARYPVLQQALAEGAEGLSGLGPAAAGLLDFVAPMVPALASMASAPVGTAVGAAIGSIVPGAGTAVGAAIGGMVSAALPVVLPMLVEAARDALRGGESSPTGGSARAHPSLSPALARNQTRGAHEALSTTSSPRARQETMTAEGGSWSMQTEMERLKMLINGMQQMQQAMSNILNTMHQGTMNVVRNIR